ncbi:hypothetical protein PISMIDRAFT_18459 [Pisolithus microcarpus 441]|uniref:Uncharacterized protein n=1 Tax=Pisolithus microcarpus 441 TaxID=765257 RepID=A0A0C9YR21_9AGAM|nr:hypothetical protein PISMIDRAFT_18459 [Pisolithus microcarpus 441]
MDSSSKVKDLLEEEVRIMGECHISINPSNSNNNNNSLLTEKANLIMVMDYDQEYDQEYYDREESGQYNDQYEEGYESYNVEVTTLNINTANHFEAFEEEITPVPVLNQEPVEYIVALPQPQDIDPCLCSICLCNPAN